MTDDTEPRIIAVPGPHVGPTWTAAGLVSPAGPSAPVGGLHLQLPVDPAGPFGLACQDRSLGRLTLPFGIAVDRRLRVYRLDQTNGRVLRYDPERPGHDPKTPFVRLPGIEFDSQLTAAVAVDSYSLYLVAGGQCRVYGLDGSALQDVWNFPPEHRPLDVVASAGRVFFVAPHSVFVHRAGDTRPHRLLPIEGQSPRGTWTRGATDRDGLLYLLEIVEGEPPVLRVFDPDRPGRPFPNVIDPTAVRARFPFPAIRSIPDEKGEPRFIVPGSLARNCGRRLPRPVANRTLEESLTRIPDTDDPHGDFVFDSKGTRLEAQRPTSTRLFRSGGAGRESVWIGKPLDSRIFRCRWDVVELEFASLPAGSTASVQTYTADEDQDVAGLPEEAWIDGVALAGTNGDPAGDPRVRVDFPVDGPPGRFLWLRVRLGGDGYATPSLAKVELRFPRRSYLEHLPAVFSEDERGRRFLERFLAVFQAEWDQLESRVDDIAGLFDPAAVPPSHLDALAGWFGVAFENGTPADARRRLLEQLPGVAFAPRPDGEDRPGGPRRGTPAALRDYLAAILPSVTGDPDLETGHFPLVIEGFRERDYYMLAADGTCEPAGPATRLFGPDAVGRIQLGGAGRLGEGKLLPADRPDLDLFASHAHRFRVVVPEAWVRTPAAEAALRRAIDAEKPAHAAYDLEPVGPRFRIGVQSTVGVDTILAGPEPLRLGRATPNAVLGSAGDEGPPGAGPIRLHPASRLGLDAGRL